MVRFLAAVVAALVLASGSAPILAQPAPSELPPQPALDRGFSYADIHALPGYTIDHIDFKFESHGHPGLPVPHYDLHAYYVTPAVQATICPDGIPDPAMKAANAPSNR